MGYANAGLVRTYWGHLPGNAYKVLNEMAWSSIDEDQPPRYFGGTAKLTGAMGRRGDPTESDLRVLSTAIKQLVQAGAIGRSNHSGKGARAEYVLHLWPSREGFLRVDNPASHERNLRVDNEVDDEGDGGPHEQNVRDRTNKTFGTARTKRSHQRTREEQGRTH